MVLSEFAQRCYSHQDLGWRDTLRIYLHTDTSEVFLKHIPFTRYPNIGHEERSVLDSLRKKAEESENVTLLPKKESGCLVFLSLMMMKMS